MVIPELVTILLNNYDAYLVGKAAEHILFKIEEQPSDFDVIIPTSQYNNACKTLMKYEFIRFTFAGGLKLRERDTIIDVWSMDLGEYFQTIPDRYEGWAMNKNKHFIKRYLE